MNIGVDIKALHACRAGIATYIRSTLDELQRLDTANRYFLFEKNPSSYRVVNPLWRKVVIPSHFPGTVWLMGAVPLRFKRYSIDVFWGPEQILPCLLPFGKVRMVCTVHDVAVKRFPGTMQTTNLVVNRLFLARSLARSRIVMAVSACVRDDVCGFFPQQAPKAKVEITYEGWQHVATAPPVKREGHLLFAGSFEPRKNLLAVLRALSLLKTDRNLVVHLKIVGPAGWKNGEAKEYIKSSGLSGQVSMPGFLSESDFAKEYRLCKALIYPSRYEGFGLPVLEALSLESPVLTSRGTSMEEIAGECCVLFDPADPRDIADKIAALYHGEIDTGTLLAKRNSVLAKYSWRKTAEQTLAVLTKAAAA